MKSWEIWSWTPPGWTTTHPVVIVSNPGRVANKANVNVLGCSSQRANRPPLADEVVLDSADGLDWATLCRCDELFHVAKADLKDRRGQVSPERRRFIIATINRAMGWV
jgi:hypothetical protein